MELNVGGSNTIRSCSSGDGELPAMVM
jgi:hypothetical protein